MGRDITGQGISKPMTPAAYVDAAQGWARELEDREARRTGMTVAEARKVVANRTTVAPGTLENLRKGRLKAVAAHVFERLRTGVIAELEAEVMRLEHELTVLRQTGSHPGSDEMAEVEAGLAKAREALGI